MAVEKVLARGWSFEINTGTEGAPTWTKIGGIETFSIEKEKTDAEGTDFDSAGWAEHVVAERGVSISLEGFHKEDSSTGDRDAGQEAVEALADAVGDASLDQFRMTSPGGNTWTFYASADVGGPGGGRNDYASWSCTLKVSGQITKA